MGGSLCEGEIEDIGTEHLGQILREGQRTLEESTLCSTGHAKYHEITGEITCGNDKHTIVLCHYFAVHWSGLDGERMLFLTLLILREI